MSRARDVARLLDRLRSRRWAIYAVWVAVLVVSFAAGGVTLGLLTDYESVGTEDDPNTVQVIGNWDGFGNDAGMANTNETGTPTNNATAAVSEGNESGSSEEGKPNGERSGGGTGSPDGKGAGAASLALPAAVIDRR